MPLGLCKPKLPRVSETAGDMFFCPPSSHLLCRVLCGASLGFSEVCVCVWYREGGREEPGGGMSSLRSLHFGMRTGSGLSRGNMTSSFSSSSLFLPLSVPPPAPSAVLHPSAPRPLRSLLFLLLPELLQAVTCRSSVCVSVCVFWTLNHVQLASLQNK